MLKISTTIPFTVRVNSADIGDGSWKLVSENRYECAAVGLRVDVKVDSFDGTGAVRQVNTITNIGSEKVLLSGFSSAKIRTAKGLIGVDRNRWQAEGQWQFFTPAQIDQLREIVDDLDIPVLCFGLRTDFLTHLFPGSHRLFELADSISEIKTICQCGVKATVNARLDANGNTVTEGDQVLLGGNDTYVAMCHKCWKDSIRKK